MSEDAAEAPDRSTPPGLGMDTVVGYVLLVGVLLSIALIVSGLAWHWAVTGHLELTYRIVGMNLLQFVSSDAGQLASRPLDPQTIVSAGMAVLMLTPYVRVIASVAYFALAERNWKYVAFTTFVLGVLTYTLFLR
ncbi:MAG: DUF1634 domain-containing protein [Anaerolineae bacterium]|jgi:uncharacterized membrane protein